MKTSNAKAELQQLDGIIEMARLRVKIAEKRRKETKEQAREAKRKFKEMKALSRHAKQEAKQAKADLAEARDFLDEAEAKLAASTAPVATARGGRPIPSASIPGTDTATQVPSAPGAEGETPTPSVQTGAVAEKPSVATSHGVFGNWR